jgi:hypothetical protein
MAVFLETGTKIQTHIFTYTGNITSCTIKTHSLGGFQHGLFGFFI